MISRRIPLQAVAPAMLVQRRLRWQPLALANNFFLPLGRNGLR